MPGGIQRHKKPPPHLTSRLNESFSYQSDQRPRGFDVDASTRHVAARWLALPAPKLHPWHRAGQDGEL